MWGMAGGRSKGEQGGERYRRKERKDVEVGVLKGWETGEIEKNTHQCLIFCNQKTAKRRKPKKSGHSKV